MVNNATGILECFHLRCVSLCSISFSSISFLSLARNLAAAVAAAAALPAVAPRASNDASSPPRAQLNRKFGTSARGRCHAATTAESSAVRSPGGVSPALRAVAFFSRRGRARLFGHEGFYRVPDQARQRRGCGRSVEPCWACGGFERLCGAPAGGAASPISVAWGGQDPRHHERSVRIRPAPGFGSRAACGGETSSCRESPASF